MLLLDVFETVIDALTRWSNSIGLGMIVIIALGLVLLTIIVSFFATQRSIERKTTRAVAKVNNYLEKHPFITEENLVEFNNLMKHIPVPMRSQWQQFMVNRDKKPSEFFTDNNCIEKPFKASAYQSHIIATRAFSIVIAVLSFVFCMAFFAKSSTDTLFSYQSLLTSLLIPAFIIVIVEIYIFFLKTRRNSLISDLYASFSGFRKSLDRAVTTLPEYVDYEILFTRKEITAGIPVLQEYLEQRARYEQEQIKKAKESEVVHENYDFSALGVDGSLVMEKAMRECEYFLGNQKRILAEISEIESSRDMLDKNYDEKNKTTQRKLRDIKESLDRLKEKLDATTNLIVGNDLRKQRENEIQKQRQLEKESEDDNRKYEEDKKKLNEQIEAKRAEIEGFRKNIEVALNNEFMNYADKIYADLDQKLTAEHKQHMDSLSAEIVTLQQALEDKDRIIVEKSTIVGERDDVVANKDGRIAELEQYIQDNQYAEKNNVLNAKNKEIFAVKKELESRNIELEKKERQIEHQKEYIGELKSKKNIVGDQLYTDENGVLYYIDAFGNKKYIAKTVNSVAELNNEYFEQDLSREQIQSAEGYEINQNEEPQTDANLNVEIEQNADAQNANQDSQEVNSSLGFTDADLTLDENEHVEMEHKAQEQDVQPQDNAEQSVADQNNTAESENVEEPFDISRIDALFNEIEDDNQKDVESQEQNIKVDAEPENAVKAEDEKSEDIEEIDKMIEEQNAELEKQQENLAKQLEETQNIASVDNTEGDMPHDNNPADENAEAQVEEHKQDLDVQEPKEDVAELKDVKEAQGENDADNAEDANEDGKDEEPKPIHKEKKSHNGTKASAVKKLNNSKSSKNNAQKAHGAKKPVSKKSKLVAKQAPKSTKKLANAGKPKTGANKHAKNSTAKKKKSDVGGNTPIVNLNLSQFNTQLKKMMKDIDKGNK